MARPCLRHNTHVREHAPHRDSADYELEKLDHDAFLAPCAFLRSQPGDIASAAPESRAITTPRQVALRYQARKLMRQLCEPLFDCGLLLRVDVFVHLAPSRNGPGLHLQGGVEAIRTRSRAKPRRIAA